MMDDFKVECPPKEDTHGQPKPTHIDIHTLIRMRATQLKKSRSKRNKLHLAR
jgi:hypothetical protein